LSDVSIEAFAGLGNLRELDLTESKFKVIRAGLFSSTPKLIELNLVYSDLESVEMGAFDDLENILHVSVYDEKELELFKPFEEDHIDIELSDGCHWTCGSAAYP
jgi:hypothetical protein